MHILCAYTDQKLAQQGQKNSTSVFTALTTFRISGTWLTCCCTMHMVANRVAGMVANMVADKEVDQVADKVAGHGCWLIGPKLFRPKPYLTCVSTKPCEFIQRIFCSGVRWHH